MKRKRLRTIIIFLVLVSLGIMSYMYFSNSFLNQRATNDYKEIKLPPVNNDDSIIVEGYKHALKRAGEWVKQEPFLYGVDIEFNGYNQINNRKGTILYSFAYRSYVDGGDDVFGESEVEIDMGKWAITRFTAQFNELCNPDELMQSDIKFDLNKILEEAEQRFGSKYYEGYENGRVNISIPYGKAFNTTFFRFYSGEGESSKPKYKF